MLDFDTEIVKYKIENIDLITNKIADITIISMEEYNKAKTGNTEEDSRKYKEYESFLTKFMCNGDKIVTKYGNTHKLYILCTNHSKAITKRKIIQFLKEKENGIE